MPKPSKIGDNLGSGRPEKKNSKIEPQTIIKPTVRAINNYLRSELTVLTSGETQLKTQSSNI